MKELITYIRLGTVEYLLANNVVIFIILILLLVFWNWCYRYLEKFKAKGGNKLDNTTESNTESGVTQFTGNTVVTKQFRLWDNELCKYLDWEEGLVESYGLYILFGICKEYETDEEDGDTYLRFIADQKTEFTTVDGKIVFEGDIVHIQYYTEEGINIEKDIEIDGLYDEDMLDYVVECDTIIIENDLVTVTYEVVSEEENINISPSRLDMYLELKKATILSIVGNVHYKEIK